jgi:hypothetical protein
MRCKGPGWHSGREARLICGAMALALYVLKLGARFKRAEWLASREGRSLRPRWNAEPVELSLLAMPPRLAEPPELHPPFRRKSRRTGRKLFSNKQVAGPKLGRPDCVGIFLPLDGTASRGPMTGAIHSELSRSCNKTHSRVRMRGARSMPASTRACFSL